MRLQLGLDLLHRRIEEWAEEALIVGERASLKIEAFEEYGADLIATLHDLSEELELSSESLGLTGTEVPIRELCEELWNTLREGWEMVEFADQPMEFRVEELHTVLVSVAGVLSMPPDEFDDDTEELLEESVELLDEYLSEV